MRRLSILCALVLMAAMASVVYAEGPVKITKDAKLGNILVDGSGRTLYMFTRDEKNKSNCSGTCAQSWPPLVTVDAPKAEEGVDTAKLGTTAREDGSKQVTYNGLPLYFYSKDSKTGDTTGQNVGGIWFVVSTAGEAVKGDAPATAAAGAPQALPKTGADFGPSAAPGAMAFALLLLGTGVLLRRRTA